MSTVRTTRPAISRMSRIVLVVGDPGAMSDFVQRAFDATLVRHEQGDAAYATLLGLPGVATRQTILRIGEQEIGLLACDPPGRPYPHGSGSTDLWFQHFAIIVSDMASAHARLLSVGRFTPISDAPQRLPPSSGSVTAFKFRDAEDHPLELLAFPPGAGPATWEAKRSNGLFLGVDHSAVAVGDTARSIAFFESGLGLTLGAQSENRGPAQSRMDDVPDARVTVSGLMPDAAPPHIELLGYHVGPRRPVDAATTSADHAATHVVLDTEDLDSIVAALNAISARFVSPGIVTLADGSRAVMVLDPDGHRFVVRQRV